MINRNAKWASKRLEAFAHELEAIINATSDDDKSFYLSEALDKIMDADNELEEAGWED